MLLFYCLRWLLVFPASCHPDQSHRRVQTGPVLPCQPCPSGVSRPGEHLAGDPQDALQGETRMLKGALMGQV